MAIVYKITNKINGKVYYGMTVRTLEERWSSHLSSVRQRSKFRFHSAIRKYGVDCWDLCVVESSNNIEYIRKLEESLILEHKTTLSQFGYNAKPGGCGGWIVKPENYLNWKINQSAANVGELNGRFSGITNDKLFNLTKIESIRLGRIPGMKHMIKNFDQYPKHFSNFRFGGSYKNLAKLIEEETGLLYEPHYRTKEHKTKLSEANLGKNWYHCDELMICKQFRECDLDQRYKWIKGRKKYVTGN